MCVVPSPIFGEGRHTHQGRLGIWFVCWGISVRIAAGVNEMLRQFFRR